MELVLRVIAMTFLKLREGTIFFTNEKERGSWKCRKCPIHALDNIIMGWWNNIWSAISNRILYIHTCRYINNKRAQTTSWNGSNEHLNNKKAYSNCVAFIDSEEGSFLCIGMVHKKLLYGLHTVSPMSWKWQLVPWDELSTRI